MSISTAIENQIARYDLPIVTLETRRILRGGWHIKAALVIAGIMAALTFLVQILTPAIAPDIWILCFMLLGFVNNGVAFLVTPLYSSKVIASAKESGMLQMLSMTPMSNRSILGQWFILAVAPALIAFIISLPVTVVACAIPEVTTNTFYGFPYSGGLFANPIFAMHGAISYPVKTALYCATGMFCSCYCSSATSATVMTYVLIIMVIPILKILLIELPIIQSIYAYTPKHTVATNLSVDTIVIIIFTWLTLRKFKSMRRSTK